MKLVSVKAKAGFTLIECLIYIAVLFLVTGLAFAVYFSLLTHHRNIVRCTDDILRAVNAGERWRADVRAAVAPLTLETNAGEQALHIRQATGSVTYLFSGGSIWRIINETMSEKPWLDFVKTSRMHVDPRSHVRAWTWDLELVVSRKKAKIIPVFAFLAAEPIFPANGPAAAPVHPSASATASARPEFPGNPASPP